MNLISITKTICNFWVVMSLGFVSQVSFAEPPFYMYRPKMNLLTPSETFGPPKQPPLPKKEKIEDKNKKKEKKGPHGGLLQKTNAGITFEFVAKGRDFLRIYMQDDEGNTLRPNIDVKIKTIHLTYFPTRKSGQIGYAFPRIAYEFPRKRLVTETHPEYFKSVFKLPEYAKGYYINIRYFKDNKEGHFNIRIKFSKDMPDIAY